MSPELAAAAATVARLAVRWRGHIDHVCQSGTAADIVAADLEMVAARYEAEALAREAARWRS